MEIANIQKKYTKNTILRNITFSCTPGTCIGILGGNGSGKSTLLSILAGVNKCDSGSFTHNGENLFTNEKLRSALIGYVPQSTPLFEELTSYDNLSLWYEKQEIETSLKTGVLGMLGINDFCKKTVSKLSGGMKKRLAIGCAVAHNPKVLLLDEPSAALDLICKERIYNYLSDFKAKGGTIILATHDIQELHLCDKLYILKNGVLEDYKFDGNVSALVGKL